MMEALLRCVAGLAVLRGAAASPGARRVLQAGQHRLALDAAAFHSSVSSAFGARLALPATPEAMVEAWPALFGEGFEERGKRVKFIVVLHCFSSREREGFLRKWLAPGYLGKARHVFASDRLDVDAGIVGFPDDPGEMGVDFRTNGNKYLGAHRPLAAILFVNDTWGGTFDWILQGDDDTKFDMGRVARILQATREPRTTPVLGGRIGPRHGDVAPKCRESTARRTPAVDCCRDLNSSCPVDVEGAELRAHPGFFQIKMGNLERLDDCAGAGALAHKECCATEPSPPGERRDAGYLYTLAASARAPATFSVPRSWTYGGTGYVLSGGLLGAIARDDWRWCLDVVICGNADQRIHTCVFNLGFSYHVLPNELGIHRKTWRHRARRRLARLAKAARGAAAGRSRAAAPHPLLVLPAALLGLAVRRFGPPRRT